MNFKEWIEQYESEQRGFSSGAKKAWEYKQQEIDAMKKQLIDMQRKLNSISIDEIRPRHSEYDYGWRDCSKTILDDLKEVLK